MKVQVCEVVNMYFTACEVVLGFNLGMQLIF